MRERNQTFDRLAKAHAKAEKISSHLKALTKGAIVIDGVIIPQTTQAWRKNNLLAAKKIDAIFQNINALNSDKLTTTDLNKLAEWLEYIPENFRYNTEKNRNSTDKPIHVYLSDTNYRDALRNSSVPDTYLHALDAASDDIAAMQRKQIGIVWESESEVVFEDDDEEAPKSEPFEKLSQIQRERLAAIRQLEKSEIKCRNEILLLKLLKKDLPASDQVIVTNLLNNATAIVEEGSKINLNDIQLMEQQYAKNQEVFKNIHLATKLLSGKKNREPLSQETKLKFDAINGVLDDIRYPIFLDTPEKTSNISQEPHGSRDPGTTTANKADLESKLGDADATAETAIWGMVGSGGVLGSAAIVGAVFFGFGIALGPIGWGILGGIAAVSLVGLVASAVMGNAAEERADAIETQIEEMSPDGGGYRDVSDRRAEPPKPAVEHQASSDTPTTGRPPAETPGMKQ